MRFNLPYCVQHFISQKQLCGILVPGVAMERSGTGTCGGSDGGTFKCASRLVADDAAGCRTDEAASCGAALGVGARRVGAVRKGEGRGDTGDDKNDVLHGVLDS